MYKLIRPILFKFDAETVLNAVNILGKKLVLVSSWLESIFRYEHPILESSVFGLRFKNPVGLAPGFDKNGGMALFLSSLGFGFMEIGSVTPLSQRGNPRPRMFLLSRDSAMINRMGFNSVGADVVAGNLKKLAKRDFAIGVNLGKNKETPNEEALRDYSAGFRRLAEFADYVVINVSSPNTPGLRELQDKEKLRELLMELRKLNHPPLTPPIEGGESLSIFPPLRGEVRRGRRPLLLKIAPDLTDGQLDDIAAVALDTQIDGIIATNTSATQERGGGGLSGRPIQQRSTEVIAHLYKKLHSRVAIIGAGGIFSAEDAYQKIRAGASVVEIFTGLVFEGPGLVKKIKQGLVELLRRDGFRNIKEAVGADLK